MRTYAGSIDPTGHPRVVITETPDPPPVREIADFLAELAAVSTIRHLGRPHPEPERRARVLRWKAHLLDEIRHAEHTGTNTIPARSLPHTPLHSPDGFGWGYAGSGPADLAHAILHRELAENVPPDVYLHFRDEVIASLPADRFELPASDVWDWIRTNRALVEDRVFGAAPPPAPSPPAAAAGGGLGI